jgi:hypothetical protein
VYFLPQSYVRLKRPWRLGWQRPFRSLSWCDLIGRVLFLGHPAAVIDVQLLPLRKGRGAAHGDW